MGGYVVNDPLNATVNDREVNNIYDKSIEALDYCLELIALDLSANVPDEMPARTGFMKNSVGLPVKLGFLHYGFKIGAPYWIYVHEGTSDHFIAPVKKRALHWRVGNKHFFSKGHMVSGIRANPFVDRAIDRTMSIVDLLMDEAIKQKIGD